MVVKSILWILALFGAIDSYDELSNTKPVHSAYNSSVSISLHSIYSILCWSTFGRNKAWNNFVYDATSFAHIFFAFSQVFLCRTSQPPSGWMENNFKPFSDLSKDVQSFWSLGSGSITQGHSQSGPEEPPLLCRLCVWGCCFVGRWTFAPVRGLECSGAPRMNIKDISLHCCIHLTLDHD